MKAERFHALDKAVRQNDPQAMEIMQSWWAEHQDLECYACGSEDVPRDPVYSMILPSYTDTEHGDHRTDVPLVHEITDYPTVCQMLGHLEKDGESAHRQARLRHQDEP